MKSSVDALTARAPARLRGLVLGAQRSAQRIRLGERPPGFDLAAREGVSAFGLGALLGDLAALQTVGLPIYSRGLMPVTFGELHVMADLNVPIACAGVLIMPGDVLVGDPEGVIAIPQAVAAQVAEEGAETERRDAFSRAKVEAGHPLAEAYPLSGTLRAEYEVTKARGGARG